MASWVRRHWLVALTAVLGLGVAAAGFVLSLPRVQYALVQKALDALDPVIAGRIDVERVGHLSPWRVALSRVRIVDAKGHEQARIAQVDAHVAPVDLLSGRLHLVRVRVEGLRADLGPVEAPAGVVEALRPAGAGSSGGRAGSVALEVRVDDFVVREARVDATWRDAPLGLEVQVLQARGRWSERPRLIVRDLDGRLYVRGKGVGRLRGEAGAWDAASGGSVHLDGNLGSSTFELGAELAGLHSTNRGPVTSAVLHVRQLGPGTLLPLGIDIRGYLQEPVDVEASLVERRHSLEVEAALTGSSQGAPLLHADAEIRPKSIHCELQAGPLNLHEVVPPAPDLRAVGQLTLDYPRRVREPSVALRWRALRMGDYAVPDGSAELSWSDPWLRVRSLRSTSLHGSLVGRGRWNLRTGSGRGRVSVRALALDALEVPTGLKGQISGTLRVALDARGVLSGGGDLHGRHLDIAGASLRSAAFDLDFGGSKHAPRLRVDGRVQRVHRGTLRARRVRASVEATAGEGMGLVAQLRAVDARWGQSQTARVRARLRASPGAAVAHLSLQPQRGAPSELDVRAQRDAGAIRLDGSLRLGHTPPWSLRARATLRDAGLRVRELALHSGEQHLEVRGRLRGDRIHAQARIDGLQVAPWAHWLGWRRLQGRVDGSLRVAGPMQNPRVNAWAELSKLQLQTDGGSAQQLHVRADLDPSKLVIQGEANQRGLRLLSVDARFDAPREGSRSWLRSPQRALDRDFDIDVELARTRLDQEGGALGVLLGAYGLDLPLQASAKVQVKGTEADVRVQGDARVEVFNHQLDSRCAPRAHTELRTRLELREGQLEARVQGTQKSSGELDARVDMPLDLRSLLRGRPEGYGPARLHARARAIALQQIPGLCGLSGGTASATLSARGVGSADPRVEASVQAKSLGLAEGSTLGVDGSVHADAEGVSTKGHVSLETEPAGHFHARLPWRVSRAGAVTLADDAPLDAVFQTSHFPVSPIVQMVDALGQPSGALSAELRLGGTLRQPRPRGWVELEDVGFSIASVAQPLRHMQGRLQLDGRSLQIRSLKIRDRDGSVQLDGDAHYTRDGGGEGTLRAKVDKLPIRRHGTVMGEISTQLRADLRIDSHGQLQVDSVLDGGRVWVTGKRGSKVQSLEPLPEIRFASGGPAPRPHVQVPVRLTHLTLRSDRSLWVMHDDFSVKVAVDLGLTTLPRPRMRGAVQLERGELTLLGKEFRVVEGEIRFTGGSPPDPQLRVRASHALPSGKSLVVQMSGRALAPQLAFSGAASTVGGALSALIGVGGPQQMGSAQTDASNFAINLLAGLLSATARHRFGEWVPLLSVDSDQGGIERVRAGFDASDLIPGFMSDYARGLYVEGIVGQGSQAHAPLGVGVSAEVAWPHDLVTTGSYGPGFTWSADMGWSP